MVTEPLWGRMSAARPPSEDLPTAPAARAIGATWQARFDVSEPAIAGPREPMATHGVDETPRRRNLACNRHAPLSRYGACSLIGRNPQTAMITHDSTPSRNFAEDL